MGRERSLFQRVRWSLRRASARRWKAFGETWPRSARVLDFVREVWVKYHRDDCLTYAAGICFFLSLSALPLATLFFRLMALVLGSQAYSQAMVRAISQLYPYIPHHVLGDAIHQSRQVSGWDLSWVVLVVGAHWGINQLDRSLCHIFGLRFRSHRQTRQFHIARRVGITLGGLAFLVMLVSAGFEWALQHRASPASMRVFTLLPPLVVLIIGTQVLQHLPRRHVRFHHALLGGLVTMALWWVAKWAFGLYLAHTPTWGILYGTLGNLMAAFVFLYYSCCIFLLGAEVTAAFYRHESAQSSRPR
nr:YihY/virulence factor BrkB family protein [uncultured Holophaga sp.]